MIRYSKLSKGLSMDFEFGDIVYDKVSGVEAVVYKMDSDSITCDGARGEGGFDKKHVPHNYSKGQFDELRKTGYKDIAKAIRLQCFYSLKEVDRLEYLFKEGRINQDELDEQMLTNYLSNISMSCKES